MSKAVEKYYSVNEAATLLGFCNRWILDRIHKGEFIGTFHVGNDYRIPASTLNKWIELRTVRQRETVGAE